MDKADPEEPEIPEDYEQGTLVRVPGVEEELRHHSEIAAATILVYGRPTCPSVPPVLRLLDEAGVAYDYVNVRQDFEAAARLRQITGGYESVPTLVFPDGRTLIEPGTAALRRALHEAGSAGAPTAPPAATDHARLSNRVYWLLALIGLALLAAVAISIQ